MNAFPKLVFLSLAATGNPNLDNAAFGLVTSQLNEPRRMQLGPKLYW